jgi:Ca2+-binding EF-hand superfamily protein
MLSFSQKFFFAIMLEELTHILDMVQVFDKHNRGYISASDLRAVLQCLGEDLSEEESK